MNKKYLLFAGNSRTTGWDGFIGKFDSEKEAYKFLISQYNFDYDWAEIVDIEQLKVVWTGSGMD